MLVLNLAVAVAKGVYGLVSGSLVVASDAVHSLLDTGANVVGLVVLAMAAEPPDKEHPYGHRKLEAIAAAALGLLIALVAVRFGWKAIEALAVGRQAPATSIAGFVIIGGTWVVNGFVAAYEARRAKELRSTFLAADAAHTASDVAVTGAVMASFAAAHAGVQWADPLGALVVLVVILAVAWKIFGQNVPALADAAVMDARAIEKTALAVEGVRGCHRIRSRGTALAAHIDLHLLAADDLSLRESHALGHRVESALKQAFPEIVDVTIHVEPEEDGHEEL